MILNKNNEIETLESDLPSLSNLQINGEGTIEIINTGGSSAGEGGMGTGGGPEKGAGIDEEGNEKTTKTKEEADETWDPLKPKEEKGKEKS